MKAAYCRRAPPAVLLLGGWLAACQPLPHPFADDRPPAGLLTVRDTAAVTIAPIDGEPLATATKLGAALAHALQERDIAASERTASLGSYELSGIIQEMPAKKDGNAAIVVLWQLRNAEGQWIGERTERLEAAAQDWNAGSDEAVTELAAASAEQLVGLLQEEPPAEAPAEGHTRLSIRTVSGAPGDGEQSLAAAMANVLKRQDIDIVTDATGAADLYLDGEVAVAKPKDGKQNVKIVWHVRRPDGSEIGNVGQENDVPDGLLNGSWGDVANVVATSAGDGIIALVEQGAPQPKGKS